MAAWAKWWSDIQQERAAEHQSSNQAECGAEALTQKGIVIRR
jgi:hypothetical protein